MEKQRYNKMIAYFKEDGSNINKLVETLGCLPEDVNARLIKPGDVFKTEHKHPRSKPKHREPYPITWDAGPRISRGNVRELGSCDKSIVEKMKINSKNNIDN